MLDRVNYRFLDTKEHVMLDWDCICQAAFNCTRKEGNEIQRYGLMYFVFTTPQRFIPLQCTGLKDKTGKLIFEGDIVKSSTTYWNGEVYSHNGLVCWDRTKWQIGVMKYERTKSRQNKRYDRALDFARFVSFQDNTPLKKFANVEVIGNVYENPELLERKC